MWQLDKKKNQPLYQQIVEAVIEKIKNKELLVGEKLPSERKLAEMLAVNRSTVISAYAELEALDYVTRVKGSGTRIKQLQDKGEGINWWRYFDKEDSRRDHQLVAEIEQLRQQESVVDAYTGDLMINQYPNYQLPLLTYQDFSIEENKQPQGVLSLRKAIQALVLNVLHFEMVTQNMLITAGGQQSLFLIINALLKAQDVVVVEQPSYFYSMPIFKEKGIKTLKIPYTLDGFDWDKLEQLFKENSVKLFFINPTFQNPTGKTLTLQQRKRLVTLCQRYQVVIVEDDVFGLLSYPSSKRLPRLKMLSPDNVIYLGSLTKILGPTLKIGWIEAPKGVINELVKVRTNWEQEVGGLAQIMTLKLLEQPSFYTSLETFRLGLEHKMTFFTHMLKEIREVSFIFEEPQGSYYLWLTFNNKIITKNDWSVFMKKQKILILPAFLMEDSTQSIRINVGRLNYLEMKQVVSALASMLD